MKLTSPKKISIILTTYNWPQALRSVLLALKEQNTAFPFEIIIADDGSGDETAKLIRSFKSKVSIPVLHLWQADEGFRAAAIRNKAIMAAEGDYLVFLDGDCIPGRDFIEQQLTLAEANTFVVGNRVLLSREFTLAALSQALALHRWPLWRWICAAVKGQCNRFSPFLRIPLGRLRHKNARRWQGAKGCNLAVWKSDLLKVNGWEENFEGWGYEDSDLAIRLLSAGVLRKSGRFSVPVIHLWHPENDRSREQKNWVLLETRMASLETCAERGLNQYLDQ